MARQPDLTRDTRDGVLRRMLKTPPKPLKSMRAKRPKAKASAVLKQK
jgi:hypothetical protein